MSEKKKYKLMKVFDCQDMPDDVRRKFFDSSEAGNDVVVDWYVNMDSDPTEEAKVVDDWLIANGAEAGSDDEEGEHVLIRHWW